VLDPETGEEVGTVAGAAADPWDSERVVTAVGKVLPGPVESFG